MAEHETERRWAALSSFPLGQMVEVPQPAAAAHAVDCSCATCEHRRSEQR